MGRALCVVMLLLIGACSSARKDYVPVALAKRYCADPKAAFDIGYYLQVRHLPLPEPDAIEKCPADQRERAASAYRSGIARAAGESKCKSTDAEALGKRDALAGAPENVPHGCELADLRPGFESAYLTAYRNTKTAACDQEIAQARSRGHADGMAGSERQPPFAQNSLCGADKIAEVRSAYESSYRLGTEQACADEIRTAAAKGHQDGFEAKTPVLPQMQRCPPSKQAEFEQAFAAGVAEGDRDACKAELDRTAASGRR